MYDTSHLSTWSIGWAVNEHPQSCSTEATIRYLRFSPVRCTSYVTLYYVQCTQPLMYVVWSSNMHVKYTVVVSWPGALPAVHSYYTIYKHKPSAASRNCFGTCRTFSIRHFGMQIVIGYQDCVSPSSEPLHRDFTSTIQSDRFIEIGRGGRRKCFASIPGPDLQHVFLCMRIL